MMLPLLVSLVASAPVHSGRAAEALRSDDPPIKVSLNQDNYFQRGDRWDYRVLTARDAGDDREQALLDIVQRMSPDGHFDYDVAHYTVAAVDSYYSGYNRHYSPFGMRAGFGYGYGWPYYRYGFAY